MQNKLNLIINNISKTPRKIFLIDSLGGFLTALVLFTIIAPFEEYFGILINVVYFLGVFGCLYMLYSFTCYLLIKRNYKPYLKFIILVNLLYCYFTLCLFFYFYTSLTRLGITYFLLEIIVILSLIFIEYKIYQRV
ncbi:hypothetical protein D0T08_21015 [Emticicia sp. C21]|nr:hypothetical protein D0T08_21015 [Emticicia sp. C21]